MTKGWRRRMSAPAEGEGDTEQTDRDGEYQQRAGKDEDGHRQGIKGSGVEAPRHRARARRS